MRVHEIAKEFDLSSKEVRKELATLGIEAKSHMSALTEEEVERIRSVLAGGADTPPEQSVIENEEIESTEEEIPTEPESSKVIIADGPIIVKEFALELDLKPNQLIAELMKMNVFASINQKLDFKIAQRLAEKFEMVLEEAKKEPEPIPVEKAPPPEPESEDETEDQTSDQESPAPARPRGRKKRRARKEGAEVSDINEISAPPIVTFLGHVDHGKTSLLDRIRKARVAQGEDGGITQHIGAYTVEYNERKVTFLDTPGHAAFTAMRARGANLTDIAVLIVAADDGIMPQTREAIQHAQAADVCIIIAINKIDLPSANPDRVMQQLQQDGLAPEEWGGDVGCCLVSATTGEGLDELLERILLEAEMLELKANPSIPAEGFVVEAQMEPGRGPTASLLIRDGTLKVGDSITCDTAWGRVKSLINDHGIIIRTAGPSTPVKCLGLTSVPEAGTRIEIHKNDKEAKAVAQARIDAKRLDALTPKKVSMDDWFAQTVETSDVKELSILLKADVKGSLEAIEQSLQNIKSDKVNLNIVLSGVGNITNNDVLLASASNAMIAGFHVGQENGVPKTAKHEGVEIRMYSIIYELLDEIRASMTGILDPLIKETVIGHAKTLQIFNVGKRNRVAGCLCTDGKIVPKLHARVTRGEDVVFQGRLVSLKRFQSDAPEVRESQECGLRIDRFEDYRVDDIIEFYEVEKIKQEL